MSRRRRPRWLLGLALVLVGVVIGVAVVVVTREDEPIGRIEFTGTAASDEASTIDGPEGIRLQVPPGAVPVDRNGAIAQIIITIELIRQIGAVGRPATSPSGTVVGPTVPVPTGPVVPDGVVIADQALTLGPAGQTFETPVALTLPIPDGVDPGRIGGLAVFDESAASWRPVPGRVDGDRVVAEVTHLSTWAVWYTAADADERAEFEDDNGGTVVVGELADAGEFPSGFLGLPEPRLDGVAVDHGVCIESATLDDPSLEWYVNPSERIGVSANPALGTSGGAREVWLPAGTYVVSEYRGVSEVGDAIDGYVPLSGWASRQIGTLRVDAGSTATYDAAAADLDDPSAGWIAQRPACAGVVTPSLGTGDVQITLSWPETGVDLDLHVIDPAGFEIFYADQVSPSGGELDADNTFGDDVPENVFWPSGEAPDGTYRVEIDYFSGGLPARWTVRVVADGRVQRFDGVIGPADGTVLVTTFDVG